MGMGAMLILLHMGQVLPMDMHMAMEEPWMDIQEGTMEDGDLSIVSIFVTEFMSW